MNSYCSTFNYLNISIFHINQNAYNPEELERSLCYQTSIIRPLTFTIPES